MALVLLLVMAAAPAQAEGGRALTRALVYPEATVTAQAPPEIRIRGDGSPVSLFFPGHVLDERSEVHFVTRPDRLGLRIAERTAYLFALRGAQLGEASLVTLTLAGGRPLAFTVRVVEGQDDADASVQVRLPSAGEEGGGTCEVLVQRVRDELSECRDTGADRGVALVAGLLLDAPRVGAVLHQREVGWRDKQRRIYVEVRDSVRLFGRTYLRLSVENRDASGKAWIPGEPALTLEGPGARRLALPVVLVQEMEAFEVGSPGRLVLSVETPQLPPGARVRLALPERDGGRHVLIEGIGL